MFHACTYFPSTLLSHYLTHHGLRSFTILALFSVRSPSPIDLRTSLSISTSSVGALFAYVIKTGLECTTESFAFLTGSLSKWKYRREYIRKIQRLSMMMSYTLTLWARQYCFWTIRKFALTFGTLLFGIVGLVHFSPAKFADAGGSMPVDCSSWLF
jgi:hypothetical protein